MRSVTLCELHRVIIDTLILPIFTMQTDKMYKKLIKFT